MPSTKTLLVLGASGDLTERLLLPGIGSLVSSEVAADQHLVQSLTIIGSGRKEKTAADWQAMIRTAFAGVKATGRSATALIKRARYEVGDPTSKSDVERILAGVSGQLVIYFALPPAIVKKVVDVLSQVELPSDVILAFEKPFGTDARTAAALNRKLLTFVSEDQIHRVDHFLGMATVLNILGLRLANRLVEPIWNANSVEKVEILYDEDLGLEGRAGYYDTAGALIDMLQSHLLQVLSIVAMEPPVNVDANDLRSNAAQVLGATSVWTGDPVLAHSDGVSRRARYTAGKVGTRTMPAYARENGVVPERQTETLAEVAFQVATRRWSGVPFILRSGKAIGGAEKKVVITLRPVGHTPGGLSGSESPERIVIGLRPSTLAFELTFNGDGDPFSLDRHVLETTLEASSLTPYGEVMRGVLGGDPTLSIRGDVAEQCWRIVAPVLKSWASNEVPLDEYRAGTAGPTAWRK